MKLMLDTNVLLSAYAFRGTCRTIVERAAGLYEIVICEAILQEFERHAVIKLKIDPDTAASAIADLKELTLVQQASVVPITLRDPDDQAILAAAIAAKVKSSRHRRSRFPRRGR